MTFPSFGFIVMFMRACNDHFIIHWTTKVMKNDTKTLIEYFQARLHLKYMDCVKQPQRHIARSHDLLKFEPF
jgi:hypothetical protein